MAETLGFGAGGAQALQQDQLNQQQMQMNDLAMQSQQQAIQKQQRENDLDQKTADYFSKIATGTNNVAPQVTGSDVPTSRADALQKYGDLMMKAGAVKRGQDAYKASTDLAKGEADIAHTDWETRNAQAENDLKTADLVARHMGSAQDAASWDAGKQEVLASGALSPEQAAMIKSIPFSPQGAQILSEHAITAKDKAQMALTAAKEDRLASVEQQRLANEQIRTNISAQRLKETIRKDSVDKKTGTLASAPTKTELASVSAGVVNDIFDGNPPKDLTALDAGVQQITGQIKAKIRANKGMDWETAKNQAIIQSKAAGDWEFQKGGLFSDDTVKYDGTGKTIDAAIPIPVQDGKPVAGKLKKGRWYITAQGRGQWDGDGFNVPD